MLAIPDLIALFGSKCALGNAHQHECGQTDYFDWFLIYEFSITRSLNYAVLALLQAQNNGKCSV